MINALLVYPKNPKTFWSYDKALEIAGKKSVFPPTGLMTIAASMPSRYSLRLIDENIEPLKDSDIEWSDVIIASAMGIHKKSLEKIIKRANEHERPVFAGGPLPTQHHDKILGNATFFLGEAEAGFVEELDNVVREGYVPERNIVDKRKIFVTLDNTPMQRFDLIKDNLNRYQSMAIQLTRGCPEHCTFCNIPSLYGNHTRIKDEKQFFGELDALYGLGWRGSIMIVDDNVAGNQAALIPILKKTAAWQKAHNYCFNFFTQASLRIFDNTELLEAMYQAGFSQVFFGLESPSPESLKFMGAQKNIHDAGSGLSMMEKVCHIGENYFKPQAGFIMGFDADPKDIDQLMIGFIRDSRISVAMVGLLGILPDTSDYKRYDMQDRLVKDITYSGDSGMFSRQLSFIPQDSEGNRISPEIVTDRLKNVLTNINSPKEYFFRTKEYIMNRKRRPLSSIPIKPSTLMAAARSIYHQGIKSSYRSTYWKYLFDIAMHDMKDIPDAISYAVEGHHVITITKEKLKVDDVNTSIEAILSELGKFEPKTFNISDISKEYFKNMNRRFHALIRKYGRVKKDFKGEIKGLELLKERYRKFAQSFDKKSYGYAQ